MGRNDDEYRQNAAEAQAKADESRSPKQKAAWLKVAQGWLSMLPNARKTAEQRFDENAEAKGTHQERSNESH